MGGATFGIPVNNSGGHPRAILYRNSRMTIPRLFHLVVMMGLSASFVGCNESAEGSVPPRLSAAQRNSFWVTRNVDCAKTLFAKTTGKLSFVNSLKRPIKIVRVMKSCNCADIQLEIDSRSYRFSANGTVFGYAVEAQSFVPANHIDIRSGDAGVLTVDLELIQMGAKLATVDLFTDSGENIGPVCRGGATVPQEVSR